MRLTIIPIDKTVYVNEVAHENLDLTNCQIPANVHALQWYDVKGWIEFSNNDPFAPNIPNEIINELPEWANCCVTKWEEWTPPLPPEIEPLPIEIVSLPQQ